jgi:hypothetical protein
MNKDRCTEQTRKRPLDEIDLSKKSPIQAKRINMHFVLTQGQIYQAD